MNQIKIGTFIAERRKAHNLTQLQLAEMLNITDRAVSKWETGKSLPDASIMIDLCNILGITVNELLSGENIPMEDYDKELEKNLLDIIQQKEESDKHLLTLEWVVGILSLLVLFIPILIGALLPMEDWKRIVLVFSGFVPAIVGLCYATKIEQTAGYYECQACKHRYVPTLKAVIFAPHMGRTRKMTCPECHQKTWQKKVLHKERADAK